MSYLRPTNSHHFRFPTDLDVKQYSHLFLRVVYEPENLGIAVGIVLLSCIEAEIYVISIYFRLMTAIFGLRHTQT